MPYLSPPTLTREEQRSLLEASPFFPGSHWLSHPGNAVTGPAAPNPFAAGVGTMVTNTSTRGGHVRLGVYDVNGRRVAGLENGPQSAGQY